MEEITFTGLSQEEASRRLQRVGYNELPSAGPKSTWKIALEVVREPMFILLLSCGALYIILSDYREGIVLFGAVTVVIAITFFQSRKTERAMDALRKLASPRSLVLRDGVEKRIPGRELVPDDIMIIHEGDRIPADGVVIHTMHLQVDEAVLTGESMPVSKTDQVQSSAEVKAGGDGSPYVFSGTLVTAGSAHVRVTHTGIQSEFGKIGVSLNKVEEEGTRLQKEMKRLIRRFAIIGVFLCLLVIAGFYFTRGGIIQALLTGLSAAMAILPEEFPVVMTVFLALGAWRISKKNVLTRKSSAIESLGSATVLCSDKTGTITMNKMQVVAYADAKGELAIRPDNEKKKSFELISRCAFLASPQHSSDPMELAFRNDAKDLVFDQNKLLREYQFSREFMCMSNAFEDPSSGFLVYAKGAPETIFAACGLSDEQMKIHNHSLHHFAEEGLRVIGLAKATYQGTELPDDQRSFKFEFLGLIGLQDPIREEVPAAIRECRNAGIRVAMITGDYPSTAASIARQIGLDGSGILTGAELEKLSDAELRDRIRNVSVFARVVPEQKLRIVEALKANGDIVAMTGDGVNDAPALKAAHIGIAMGGKGSDVAREASSLVLVDDNFASIVASIRLGRRIYDNLQKAMGYILAIHIPIVGLTLIPAFIPDWPILLFPVHIIFMELIIDPVCSVAFESEGEEKGIMNRPPRAADQEFFSRKSIVYSLFQGMILIGMVLTVFFLSVEEGHSDDDVRSIAFSALIMANIGLVLSDLSRTRNVIQVLREPTWSTKIIIGTALLVLFLSITVPFLHTTFHFGNAGLKHFLPSLAGAVSTLFLFELIKWIRNRRSAA